MTNVLRLCWNCCEYLKFEPATIKVHLFIKKIDSGIIETGDLFFPKINGTISEKHCGHPHENILKFEKIY